MGSITIAMSMSCVLVLQAGRCCAQSLWLGVGRVTSPAANDGGRTSIDPRGHAADRGGTQSVRRSTLCPERSKSIPGLRRSLVNAGYTSSGLVTLDATLLLQPKRPARGSIRCGGVPGIDRNRGRVDVVEQALLDSSGDGWDIASVCAADGWLAPCGECEWKRTKVRPAWKA